MTESLKRAEILVSPDWVVAHLDDPKVRLVDCRFYFDGRSVATSMRRATYRARSTWTGPTS